MKKKGRLLPPSLIVVGMALAALLAATPAERVLSWVATNLTGDGLLESGTVSLISGLRVASIVLGVLLFLLGVVLLRTDAPLRLAHALVSRVGNYRPEALGSPGFGLFLVSLLGLYFEILVIRWMGSEVRIFAYFKNLTLISCFIGLGLGCALARKRTNLFPWFPLLLLLFVLFILSPLGKALTRGLRYPGDAEEFLWLFTSPSVFGQVVIFYSVVVGLFFFSVLLFVPLGQLMGRLMDRFRPLTAYSINVSGSLVGIWAFSAISFLSVPPSVWFFAGIAMLLWFFRGSSRAFLLSLLAGALTLAFLIVRDDRAIWSPYYKVHMFPSYVTSPESGEKDLWGYDLEVDRDWHQRCVDFSRRFVEKHPQLKEHGQFRRYETPYKVIKAKRVLILGAGTGNDVASALRNGAEEVDAVEIDPAILKLGERLHPEQPYSSPKVRRIVDDARSFFKKTDKKYDLIVFSLVDSHTLFSSLSSIRLDNYVYTLESFREAQRLLDDDGMLFLSFGMGKYWISKRIYEMLRTVFGEHVLVTHELTSASFFAGKRLDPESLREELGLSDLGPGVYKGVGAVKTATDDWPFLYMRHARIPSAYWTMIVLIAVIATVIISCSLKGFARIHWHFFFLGGAFLLIEVKSITEMALVFGSTWIVNAVVFSAILLMILAANVYVGRFRTLPVGVYYACLFGTLLLNYIVPFDVLLQWGVTVRAVLASVKAALPLFFAGIIFAKSFKGVRNIDTAFGSNLLGAVLGGLLEYGSLVWGIRSLCLLAIVIYALSFLALRKKIG